MWFRANPPSAWIGRFEVAHRAGPWCWSWLVAMLMMLTPTLPAFAADRPAWADRPYPYVIVDQGVRSALRQFGRNLSIPVVMANMVSGQVHGRIKARTAKEFLEQLCQASGLAWFYDGSALYVSKRSNLKTQAFSLDDVDREQLMRRIDRLKVGQPLTARLVGDTLRATGPDSWLSAVQSVVDDSRRAPAGTAQVRVFRGGGAPVRHTTPPEKNSK
ncbi:hypothetical protein [Salinisphaera sp.]|uniref:hypothetical protein n=1 Tax=Salinisphaera sp. TaxID=1914330 RepID=UPI002D769646|nr:hypothetical protein [Salinisphaera sp.]HET7314018.1 hypothetical protein [Salinisphaera sp.]